MRLRQLQIKGFKSLVDQTIPLGLVNCFIGANGAGKSNVLEALGVLSAAAGGRVDDEAIIRRGVRAGLPRLYKASFAATQIPPHIFLEARSEPDATFRVALLNPLESPEPAWTFKTEFLSSGSTEVVSQGVRSEKKNLDRDAGLSALKIVDLLPDDPAALLLRKLQGYVIYSPNTPALRGTVQDPQMRLPLGLSGGGLAEGFEALKKTIDEDRFDDVLELIDWISDVSATEIAAELLSPAVPRAQRVLKFTDRFMDETRNTLTAYDASEGSLYVLFTAILSLLPSAPSIFAIDNLDSALNPRLVTRLVERLPRWLRAGETDRQLLFTAHNPSVLDGLNLDDDDVRLFAVERNSVGHTSIRRIEISAELRKLNETYPLSRLWATGALGAVPNV